MKRFKSKWVILIGLFLLGAFVGALAYPKKYKIGMSWEEAVALAKPEQLDLHGTGLETQGFSNTDLEKKVAYSAYDSRAGLFLELDYQKRIIGVQRWKYFGIDFAKLIRKFRKDG